MRPKPCTSEMEDIVIDVDHFSAEIYLGRCAFFPAGLFDNDDINSRCCG